MNSSWKRPKIDIVKTKSEWIWDVIGYSIFIGTIIFTIVMWNKLPDQVPAHINHLGEVDRWGGKGILFIFPMLGILHVILMEVLEKYPEINNYPKRFNESNAKQFYLNSRKMLNQVKNIILLFFSFMLLEWVIISLEWGAGFGLWPLAILFIGMIIPIILGLMRQRKIR